LLSKGVQKQWKAIFRLNQIGPAQQAGKPGERGKSEIRWQRGFSPTLPPYFANIYGFFMRYGYSTPNQATEKMGYNFY